MSTEVQLELDESLQRRFGTVADDARVTRTAPRRTHVTAMEHRKKPRHAMTAADVECATDR